MSSHWERHSPSDDDDLSSIHTYSTSSTNATLDNQPGAGKTLAATMSINVSGGS